MPAIQFVTEDSSVQAMLLRLDTALSPGAIAGFLGVVVDPYLRGRAHSRFIDEGDDVTGDWLPLSPTTEEFRENQHFGAAHPINVRTGELERYIVDSPNSMLVNPASGAILTLPGEPPTDPFLLKKVTTAQKGDYRTPARPVMGMNEKDLSFVLLEMSGFFSKALGWAG